MRLNKKLWMHIRGRFLFPLIVTPLLVTMLFGWGSTGHRLINLKAVMHLPETMAALKADSLFYRSHASDADGRKNYSDTAFFQEAYRHYLDIDIYPDFHSIPHSLDSMIMLYGRENVRQNGTLPWAIVLTMDSLTAQLARNDIAKAESTMSDLGHYVGDAHQPLHCTQNYDGDMTGNDGIHSRYESSMINRYQASLTINWDSARYIASPLDFAFEFIYHSNSLVDSVLWADDYAKTATGWNGSGSPPTTYYDTLWKKTEGLTKAQFQDATVALASLWYTAWMNAQPVAYDTITTQAIGNGSITPSGAVIVQEGNDAAFTFAPQTGYHVDSVYVDGGRVDSVASYTLYSVSANHTITVWFSVNRYTLTASAGAHGSIVPAGTMLLRYDSSQTFTFNPDAGYAVDDLLVDGAPVDSPLSYTFVNVRQHHSINVTFKGSSIVIQNNVFEKWNMVSVPVDGEDDRKEIIFPSAISPAFAFNGGYQAMNTLEHGRGYWLKFDSAQTIQLSGAMMYADTISVTDGWNMIGSLSEIISTSCIAPVGVTVQSPYYEYQNGYGISDLIIPGKAYWVKISGDGELILMMCETKRSAFVK